jgi:tRNA-dihydrouridine synthase
VIGCGDVTTPQQALRRLAESGVDGVMIGRGAIANPWIFRQTSELMRNEPM